MKLPGVISLRNDFHRDPKERLATRSRASS